MFVLYYANMKGLPLIEFCLFVTNNWAELQGVTIAATNTILTSEK